MRCGLIPLSISVFRDSLKKRFKKPRKHFLINATLPLRTRKGGNIREIVAADSRLKSNQIFSLSCHVCCPDESWHLSVLSSPSGVHYWRLQIADEKEEEKKHHFYPPFFLGDSSSHNRRIKKMWCAHRCVYIMFSIPAKPFVNYFFFFLTCPENLFRVFFL